MNRWKLLVGRVCFSALLGTAVGLFGVILWAMSLMTGHWWGGVAMVGGGALLFGVVWMASEWRED